MFASVLDITIGVKDGTAGDYWKYLRNKDSVDAHIRDRQNDVYPFDNVQLQRRTSRAPEWWRAYTALKHNDVTNMHRGNLEDAIHAVAALAALVECRYPGLVPLPLGGRGAVLRLVISHGVHGTKDDRMLP